MLQALLPIVLSRVRAELTIAYILVQWLGDFAEPTLDVPPGAPPGVYFSPTGVEETGPDDGIGDAWKQVRLARR